jgi:prolyl-tRNA editing enzyme YbaK/EbsC (Cys-tRNA(Pro) deacylase)
VEEDRVKSALDVHRALLAADVPHEMVRLRTPALSADDLPRALGVPPDACVVVRCYRMTRGDGRTAVCAVMLRSGDTPDPASLLDAFDAVAIRTATAMEVNAATDYASGLVSPICLDDRVPFLADAALGGSPVLYAPTGESGVALGIQTHDLLRASGARITNLTAGPLGERERSDWHLGAGLETAGAAVLPMHRKLRSGARRTG